MWNTKSFDIFVHVCVFVCKYEACKSNSLLYCCIRFFVFFFLIEIKRSKKLLFASVVGKIFL